MLHRDSTNVLSKICVGHKRYTMIHRALVGQGKVLKYIVLKKGQGKVLGLNVDWHVLAEVLHDTPCFKISGIDIFAIHSANRE